MKIILISGKLFFFGNWSSQTLSLPNQIYGLSVPSGLVAIRKFLVVLNSKFEVDLIFLFFLVRKKLGFIKSNPYESKWINSSTKCFLFNCNVKFPNWHVLLFWNSQLYTGSTFMVCVAMHFFGSAYATNVMVDLSWTLTIVANFKVKVVLERKGFFMRLILCFRRCVFIASWFSY